MYSKESIVAISALVLISGTALAQEVVALVPLGPGDSMARDINDNNEIVGQSTLAGIGAVATRWDASGTPTGLGMLPGGVLSWGEAINNNGEMVGYSEDSTGLRKGVVWDGRGGMVDVHSAIGSLGSSIPWDINDNGLIVGQASINPGFSKGFIWDQVNPAVVVGSQGYMGGANYGTNNSGELVGSAFFFGDPDDATDWVPDGRGGYESQNITPPGYNLSIARAVNNNGMIVGFSNYQSPTAGQQACIFTRDDQNPVELLGTLPGYDTTEGLDVNDNGMVVGYAFDGTFSGLEPHAWAWANGTMYDLNDLLDDQSAFDVLLHATGVNNHGDIVGFGLLKTGSFGAFLIEEFTGGSDCAPDLNGDGNLDFFDVSAFLSAFSNTEPDGDFNGDGNYDFFDVSAFLSAFSAGCP